MSDGITTRTEGPTRLPFLALRVWAKSLLASREDAREGARATAERRPPKFTGRQ